MLELVRFNKRVWSFFAMFCANLVCVCVVYECVCVLAGGK